MPFMSTCPEITDDGKMRAMPDYVKFQLRFGADDAALRASLEAAAKQQNRSLHAEIMARLRASESAPDPIEDLRRRVEALEKQTTRKRVR